MENVAYNTKFLHVLKFLKLLCTEICNTHTYDPKCFGSIQTCLHKQYYFKYDSVEFCNSLLTLPRQDHNLRFYPIISQQSSCFALSHIKTTQKWNQHVKGKLSTCCMCQPSLQALTS